MLESLCADDKKKSLKSEMDDKHLPPLEEFYLKTFSFETLLTFNETMQEVCDLSQFWYREFFLELTMGKRIQVCMGTKSIGLNSCCLTFFFFSFFFFLPLCT